MIEASEIIFKENVPEAGKWNIKFFPRIRRIMVIGGVLAVSWMETTQIMAEKHTCHASYYR